MGGSRRIYDASAGAYVVHAGVEGYTIFDSQVRLDAPSVGCAENRIVINRHLRKIAIQTAAAGYRVSAYLQARDGHASCGSYLRNVQGSVDVDSFLRTAPLVIAVVGYDHKVAAISRGQRDRATQLVSVILPSLVEILITIHHLERCKVFGFRVPVDDVGARAIGRSSACVGILLEDEENHKILCIPDSGRRVCHEELVTVEFQRRVPVDNGRLLYGPCSNGSIISCVIAEVALICPPTNSVIVFGSATIILEHIVVGF